MKITSTLFKVGDIYYIKWHDGTRPRRKSLRTTDKTTALAAKAAQDWELRQNEFGIPINRPVTISEAIERHKSLNDLTESSVWALNRSKEFFINQFGDMPVRELRKHHMIDWRAALLAEGYSPNYVLRLAGGIQAALNTLVQGEIIQANPLAGIRTLKRKKAKPRYLDWPQCEVILATAKALADVQDPTGGFPFTAFALGFYSGLRRGEILAARWDYIKGDRMYVAGTKTESSAADVPFHATLAEALAPYRKLTGFIVQYPNGKRPSEANLWHVFKTVTAKAGAQIPEGVAWHLLRHSFAVHLVRDMGYTLEQLAPLLRHSDYESVTAMYADIRAMKGQIDRF